MIYKNMMICYDCGTQLKTRYCGNTLEVYDSESELWLSECPYCEGSDFYVMGHEYTVNSTI